VEALRIEYSGDKALCRSRIFHPMPIRFDDVLTAFEFASGDGSSEALLCKRTGRVYWRSAAAGVDEIEDELPDGAEEDPNYIAIPRKQVLGLGKALALDFALEFLPKDYDHVRYLFSRRGAYRNFRALVTQRRVLERWYDFESEATKRAVREWCELNEIEVTD
jgi:hypothetical protein